MLTDREANVAWLEIEMKWRKLEEKWRAERKGIENADNRRTEKEAAGVLRGQGGEAGNRPPEDSAYRSS